MKISPLQKARYEYSPKLPGMLRNGISEICVKEGEETQSVADQDAIKALFPNTYGKRKSLLNVEKTLRHLRNRSLVLFFRADRRLEDTMSSAVCMML